MLCWTTARPRMIINYGSISPIPLWYSPSSLHHTPIQMTYLLLPSSRIALGDLTTSHRLRLFPIYQNLPNPAVREADALFLRLVRQLNQLRAGIWAERAHVLDPAMRPWAMCPNAQSGTSSTADTLRACTPSMTLPIRNL